jgi:hypothetical protein
MAYEIKSIGAPMCRIFLNISALLGMLLLAVACNSADEQRYRSLEHAIGQICSEVTDLTSINSRSQTPTSCRLGANLSHADASILAEAVRTNRLTGFQGDIAILALTGLDEKLYWQVTTGLVVTALHNDNCP